MKIKQLKELSGLNQKQFAQKFKIPVRTVQNWEAEITEPPAYIPRMIELIMILENEIEDLKRQLREKGEKNGTN